MITFDQGEINEDKRYWEALAIELGNAIFEYLDIPTRPSTANTMSTDDE